MLREQERLRLTRLLGLWRHLVDPSVGVINEICALPIDDDDPNFFHYLSTSCDTARFTALKNFSNNGGVSTDRYVALAKAVGEGVERYCSAIFDYDDLVVAPYEALRERATPPDAFALYSPEQHARGDLAWRPFEPGSPVAWTRGLSLITGELTLVPAAMVYVPYHYMKGRGDTPIVQPISTGLACGCSFDEAALSGLCEVVERDAFTRSWQASVSPPRVDPATLPTSGEDLLRRFAERGIEVRLLDITSDVRFPTVMSVALSDAATSPAVAVSAATDPSAEVALRKSLEELAHTRKFAKQLMDYTPPVPVEPELGHPAVEDQRDHLRFYCPQEARRFAEFLWASPEERPFAKVADHAGADAGAALAALVVEIHRAGLDVIACDLTTPDIAALGLRVVRMVVPGMHPLFMGHRNRALGGRRLREASLRSGRRRGPGNPDNPYPHPFP